MYSPLIALTCCHLTDACFMHIQLLPPVCIIRKIITYSSQHPNHRTTYFARGWLEIAVSLQDASIKIIYHNKFLKYLTVIDDSFSTAYQLVRGYLKKDLDCNISFYIIMVYWLIYSWGRWKRWIHRFSKFI